MDQHKWRNSALIAVCLFAFGFLVRLLPHAPNMTPITAIAFASSLYFGRKQAMLLPLATLFASDIFLGFYKWQVMGAVYLSFALIFWLSWLAKKSASPMLNLTLIASSSVIFFLITNAAVWFSSNWYEKNFAGLLYAYEMGLPFFRNMLVGDMLYSALLLAAFAGAEQLSLHLSPLARPVVCSE